MAVGSMPKAATTTERQATITATVQPRLRLPHRLVMTLRNRVAFRPCSAANPQMMQARAIETARKPDPPARLRFALESLAMDGTSTGTAMGWAANERLEP